MKVVHVQNCLDVGGSEVMLIELAKQQLALGHDVAICTIGGEGPMDETAQSYGIKVDHLRAGRGLFNQVHALWSYLKRDAPDIVHSHWGVWLPVALAGFFAGVPRVHTHHANQRRRLFLEHRFATLFTNRVVILTPEADDYIKKYVAVPKRKIVVIPNGIDLSRVESATRIEIDGIPEDSPVVGMIARLCPPKDYSTFIRCAKLLNGEFPNVHFIAVGGGQMRMTFEEEATSLGVQNFHFLGARHDVPGILRRMSVNVLATKCEGLSITLLEGMASGCPCVASDIPANRYALGDGKAGLLVKGQDPVALAAGIKRMLTENLLREEFIRSSGELCKFFTSGRMASDYLAMYRAILGRG